MTPLQDRPTAETVSAQYADAETRIQDAVAEIVPGGEWTRYREPSTSPCSDNQGAEGDEGRGVRVRGASYGYNATPTAEQWAQILDRIAPILAEYDFRTELMDAERGNGGSAYKVAGPYPGSTFSLQYSKEIALAFISGCVPEG